MDAYHDRDPWHVPDAGDDEEPTDLNAQKNTSAENMWALRPVPTNAGYRPHVYGLGKMVIYANVANGTTLFSWAGSGGPPRQDDGHPAVDPGDASGNSSIEIVKPTSTASRATFSYTAEGTPQIEKRRGQTSLKTTIAGTGQYNNRCQFGVSLAHPTAEDLHSAAPSGRTGGDHRRLVESYATRSTARRRIPRRGRHPSAGNPVRLVQP